MKAWHSLLPASLFSVPSAQSAGSTATSRRSVLAGILALAIGLAAALPITTGADDDIVPLPPARKEGGKPLLQALSERRTIREFRPDALPLPVLSDLLWAAAGVNREDGHRTAPSAMNAQEIDIYVALSSGVHRYDPHGHRLVRELREDIRLKTSGQEFAKVAPVALVFVADLARLSKAPPGQREFYAGIDTGYISQNVYLFCASAGLGTVVHDLERGPLVEALRLCSDQRIILAQAVGYPK